MAAAVSVEQYLAEIDHARVGEILALREALVGIDPALSESIKWNAPSYGFGDQHRVTMRLHPGDCVEVVLHRGSAKRKDAFTFDDPTGLVRWLAPDRGVVEIADAQLLRARLADIVALVAAWLAATDER